MTCQGSFLLIPPLPFSSYEIWDLKARCILVQQFIYIFVMSLIIHYNKFLDFHKT